MVRRQRFNSYWLVTWQRLPIIQSWCESSQSGNTSCLGFPDPIIVIRANDFHGPPFLDKYSPRFSSPLAWCSPPGRWTPFFLLNQSNKVESVLSSCLRGRFAHHGLLKSNYRFWCGQQASYLVLGFECIQPNTPGLGNVLLWLTGPGLLMPDNSKILCMILISPQESICVLYGSPNSHSTVSDTTASNRPIQ